MSDTLKTKDELGNVLVQVQDDLRQLKRSLGRITGTERGEVLDIQALDTAICRTETCIRKRAEEYLNTANKQLLILPSIEDHKKTVQIPKWKPPLENIPERPQREDPAGTSPGEKHKSALSMRLLCNPAHPKNRDVMHQKYGIPLPDVHKKRVTSPPHDRIIKGPTVSSRPTVPGGHRSTLYLALRPSEKDKGTGIVSLLEKGYPSSEPDVCLLETPVQYKAVSLHPREDLCSSKMGLTSRKSRCQKQLTWEKEPGATQEGTDRELTPTWTTGAPAPPPTAASTGSGHRTVMPGTSCLTFVKPQDLPVVAHVATSKFPFTITEGRIDQTAADFCRFKQQHWQYWNTLAYTLGALEKLLRDFAVPVARVSGERLVDVGQSAEMGWSGRVPTVEVLLSVLENREEAWGLLSCPGQRYRGEGGTEAAAIRIQSCWRRHFTRTAYLGYIWRKRVVLRIATSWLMRTQMRRVRKALQARRFRQLENYRSRAQAVLSLITPPLHPQHLAANWKHIQSSRRTIIHIPSLGYSQSQRMSLKDLGVLQNIQISRLCDIRDENVEVIYVSPRRLGDDMSHYYTRLLRPQAATEKPAQASCTKRFTILTPDALEFFPTHSMCLSTLLKYSPRTLRRIRNLIQGKQAYIVGGVAHVDDLAVADELGVPILGPEPAVAQHYGTKSGGRRLFTESEVDVPPGKGNMYCLNQLHETLAQLMTQNIHVQRWLFKMDSEFDGRGTAYCDVSHLECSRWALQQCRRWGPDHWNTEWAQEAVLLKYLDEVPEWLARHARPAKTSCYPNWACFLKTFLRQGGVVEAYPPSDSVTCLSVDLLLAPGGEVSMLSCGDQLHGSCLLETVGSSVPQTSVCPDALRSICMRVGQACQRRLITGYVSLDLATFLDPSTLEQRVWAIDLDLKYSNQLAMTQMLLMMTSGILDCHTCRLEVPVPIKEESSAQQTAAKPPMASRYAVIGSRLFNTNLSMVHYKSFFLMCKAQGIRFDIKERQGTVFALHDSSKRYSLGMIAVSEDLQGALETFALNLSIIHQEISSPKMQGDTNFKDLIKEIEDVLRMTLQNEVQSEEDDKAVAQTEMDH